VVQCLLDLLDLKAFVVHLLVVLLCLLVDKYEALLLFVDLLLDFVLDLCRKHFEVQEVHQVFVDLLHQA
jgi:hypothetical protein